MKAKLSVVALLLWPFTMLKRLLGSQVRVKRVEGRWRVVLDNSPAVAETPAAPVGRKASRKPSRADGATPAASATVAAKAAEPAASATDEPDPMHLELRQLLAQHSAARQLMRHLAYLERTLKLAGPDGLGGLPLDVLQKALAQLEGLVSDWSSPGLAQLRLQLTMVIADKEEQAPAGAPEVNEDADADFEALKRAWAGAVPAEAATPPKG
ncbi:MAG TPA: hypothetical protein VJ743_21505 [Albitalea sp.]|nr:hypothetical protein [Albitalea sp.]